MSLRAPRARSPLALGLCLLVAAAAGCGRKDRKSKAPEGQVSQIEANRYIRRAIRQSSQGVILMPSQRAEAVFERPRLNEIAHAMEVPAARCFILRAIETMDVRTDGEAGYDNVPEGQLKVRVRIAPSGEVLRTEVLESGFTDEQMEPCLQEVFEEQRWPANKSGNAHYIDVIYWVSLGMQRDAGSPKMQEHLRREQIAAGRRAKACLQGRVDAGRYEVSGLNLVDREGSTMVNRIDTGDLPEPIRACIATALREIRLPRDAEAFVRPVSPRVTFEISSDGTVVVDGERWLELVEMEERARLAAERAALAAERGETSEPVDELPPHRPEPAPGTEVATVGAPPSEPGPADPSEPSEPTTTPPPQPALDPAKPGLRLDLGGRRGDDS